MERFDAIVVGAGPAGSVTAYHLARAGTSVLLLDRAGFPRDKPCGGGLTVRAVRELPVDVSPVVEHVVDRMEFRLRYRARFERGGSRPLVLMTQRRRLDHFLAEQAAGAGADFRDGVRVRAIAVEGDGVTVTFDSGSARAAALVGADGANGVTARLAGFDTEHTNGVAFEGNVRNDAVDAERYRGRAVIELGVIPGGYGWVFPKGDHVNVGVGGWEREGPKLRAHLGRLCAAHSIRESAVEQLRGHRLPLRPPRAPAARGRVLLVGDAAGLVDPLTGDGMYEAFVSARLAASAIGRLLAGEASGLEPYSQELARELAQQSAASWGAKIAFDRFPRLTFGLAAAPPVWGIVEGLVRGDLSHPGAARGLARGPLRLVEALARAAGDPGRAFLEVAA